MTVRSAANRSWFERSLALATATATAFALGAMSGRAEAASGSEWDALAECESGGNWDINTGNGYYGGLQFSKASWEWAGGTQYASYPHEASRGEQIAVAENLLDSQDVSNAWPACSSKLGLSQADMQSGSSGGGSDSSDSSSDDSDDSSSDDSSDSSSDDSSDTSSDESSSDDSSTEPAPGDSYEVQPGDTLARIASKLDVDGGWRALYATNDDRVSNPNVIRSGQVLRLPGGATEVAEAATEVETPSGGSGSYTVRPGDTLSEIARDQGVAGGWAAIHEANGDAIADPGMIYVGQELRLP